MAICILLLSLLQGLGCSSASEDKQATVSDEEASTEKESTPLAEIRVIRSRNFELPPELANPKDVKPGDKVVVPLFDEEVSRAEVRQVKTDSQGSITLIADIREPSPGYLISVTSEGRSLATIDMPEKGSSIASPYRNLLCKEHIRKL